MRNNDIFNKFKKYNPDTGIGKYLDDNIDIKMNDHGFYEEFIVDNEKEIDDCVLLCSTHYPYSKKEENISKELFSGVSGIKYHHRIGFYKSLYIGHVNSERNRMHSSSGGVATWVLARLFENGLIDGVIHVGRGKEELFEYKISRDLESIYSNSKTKYYPVELSKVLNELKELPGKYAIVGTPSFISSIQLLKQHDKKIDDKIVFTIGLICGHHKGKFFTEYMGWQVGFAPDNIDDINYRLKLDDQLASNYGIKINGKINGKTKEKIELKNNLKGQNWGEGYFKKEESDYVDDVFNECADITLGDAWLPSYNEDFKGNNIIIIRNEIIEELFLEGLASEELNLNKATVSDILKSQRAHITHTQDELFYRIDKFEKNSIERRLFNDKISFARKCIQRIRKRIRIKSSESFKQAKSLQDLHYFERKMVFPSLLHRIFSKMNKIIEQNK